MTPGVLAAFEKYSNSDATRYVDYWDGLAARTDAQLFRRFLFAFMSVHTTWESNVNGFQAISDFDAWRGSHQVFALVSYSPASGFTITAPSGSTSSAMTFGLPPLDSSVDRERLGSLIATVLKIRYLDSVRQRSRSPLSWPSP